MTPLYGHKDSSSGYLVDSYPYGRDRCRIKFWLESGKKGFRFVSQTEHPRTKVWNTPKKSTYMLLAGCLFLDNENHVTWRGLSEYSSASEVLNFIKDFPGADLSRLKVWVLGKKVICNRKIKGEAIITINNVPQYPTPTDVEEAKKNLEMYEEAWNLLKSPATE